MSNGTYERIKKLRYPPFKKVKKDNFYYQWGKRIDKLLRLNICVVWRGDQGENEMVRFKWGRLHIWYLRHDKYLPNTILHYQYLQNNLFIPWKWVLFENARPLTPSSPFYVVQSTPHHIKVYIVLRPEENHNNCWKALFHTWIARWWSKEECFDCSICQTWSCIRSGWLRLPLM